MQKQPISAVRMYRLISIAINSGAKSTHLLNDGMNIAQLSKLLGHAQLTTTMDYLDITTDMQAKAMISLEDEKTRSLPQKWGKGKDKLSALFSKKK